MVRSGNYEVDADGNLVEVGSPEERETPIPVQRAMRVYGFAQLVSFALLFAMAITMPDIRGLLLVIAVLYGVAAFGLHRPYRRALMRRYEATR